MPNDIKLMFDITDERIIDYEDIYNTYIEKLGHLIDNDFNYEKLFKLLNGFKFVHSYFYPEYKDMNIDFEKILEKNIKEQELLLSISCYAILKIADTKLDMNLIDSIEGNVKRDYFARRRKVKVLH